jgi:hypothetical protein
MRFSAAATAPATSSGAVHSLSGKPDHIQARKLLTKYRAAIAVIDYEEAPRLCGGNAEEVPRSQRFDR